MRAVELDMRRLAPRPELQFPTRRARLRDAAGFLDEAAAADEIVRHDAALASSAVLEADDDHSMAFGAAAPAVVAVLGADAARGDLFGVAGCADVVVAGVGVGYFAHA